MAVNPPTYSALRKMAQLIDKKLTSDADSQIFDEIKAWNRLLKRHLGEMKKQPGGWKNDRYTYDPKTGRIQRRRGNVVVAEY